MLFVRVLGILRLQPTFCSQGSLTWVVLLLELQVHCCQSCMSELEKNLKLVTGELKLFSSVLVKLKVVFLKPFPVCVFLVVRCPRNVMLTRNVCRKPLSLK